MRALLRRGQPPPERLQVADLLLDCIRRKVTRCGENIELAPKEFGILEYMMRNKGRPLSRTMIVEHVWDMDYDGLTNIVDVYIRHLRSKIDDRFPQKMIQTVRGIGYMIEAPEAGAHCAARRIADSAAGVTCRSRRFTRGLRFRLTASYALFFTLLLLRIGVHLSRASWRPTSMMQISDESERRNGTPIKGYLRIDRPTEQTSRTGIYDHDDPRGSRHG